MAPAVGAEAVGTDPDPGLGSRGGDNGSALPSSHGLKPALPSAVGLFPGPSTHITQATTALDTEASWTPTKLAPPIRGPFPASFFSGASPLAGMGTSFLPSSPSTQDASSRRTGPEAASARGPSHTPEQCQAPCQPLQMIVGNGSLTHFPVRALGTLLYYFDFRLLFFLPF